MTRQKIIVFFIVAICVIIVTVNWQGSSAFVRVRTWSRDIMVGAKGYLVTVFYRDVSLPLTNHDCIILICASDAVPSFTLSYNSPCSPKAVYLEHTNYLNFGNIYYVDYTTNKIQQYPNDNFTLQVNEENPFGVENMAKLQELAETIYGECAELVQNTSDHLKLKDTEATIDSNE
ncbi:MAG: hypothetical protein ACRCUY_00090 [Thermoguttaceae bacterium]